MKLRYLPFITAIFLISSTYAITPQETISRLTQLESLPAGTWLFHIGNVAHGESIDLDDSKWQLVSGDTDAPTDSVWYRQWITVPKTWHGYDLTGARIWFSFPATANGALSQIIYFNGKRVALGESLEPIILFDQAKPGEKMLVAIKLPITAAPKSVDEAKLKIEFAPNRPSPEELQETLAAAIAISKSFAPNNEQNNIILNKATETLDWDALTHNNQQKFDASLAQAQTILKSLTPLLNQATVTLTGNSHIDAAWKWPWTETADAVKRTFSTALQLMNEYPDYTFTQSAAQYNEWIAEKYPLINNEIKRRIHEGRWEIVGGMWVEPDLNMPDGESITRSILIGKRWFQHEYNVDVRVGWNPDSFGYNWQLPQIYKKSGIDYFVTQKMSWNDTNQLPFKLFWWQAPDGSKVLTYFPHKYDNQDVDPARIANDFADARVLSPGMTNLLDLYGVGDHGGGPTRTILDSAQHWIAQTNPLPKMNFGTVKEFFINAEKNTAPNSPIWNYQTIAKGYHTPQATPGKIVVPTWNSEMYFEYHRGIFTTQANHKRNMRQSTVEAINAEKFASLAWLFGDEYPAQQLTEAWKKITFNDFHDLAAGSGIGVIYKDAQRDYDQVRWSTNEISAKALNTIAAHINTQAAGQNPILIFNPLAWQRSGVVTIDVQLPHKTNDIAIQDAQKNSLPTRIISQDPETNRYRIEFLAKNIPSLGYKVVSIMPEEKTFASDLNSHDTTLENSLLRVAIDKKTGCITSIYNKQTQFEALTTGACGNELQLFKDNPKRHDAWNIDPGTLDQTPVKLHQADSVQMVEKNPLRNVVRIKHHWNNSTFVQDITLYAHSNEIKIDNDIDWHETHTLLKTAFPLAATNTMATYEIPFGTIQRPTTRNNTWEQAQFEVPALRWADLSNDKNGFSLINESKYGYDVRDNVMRLSLLRAPTYPDPKADRGQHHFSFALYPHAGDWRQAETIKHGYEFNYPLIANQVAAHEGKFPLEYSFLSVSPSNVILTALKKAEDSNAFILHLYESQGQASTVKLTISKNVKTAAITNLLEQPIRFVAVNGDHITVPIKAYEISAIKLGY